MATEKIECLYGKTLVSKNETRWNSQLKMVRRLNEIDVDKVVDRRELHLSAYEKLVLREFVEVLEPFEEATDILQGEKYNSISLVIPSYLGLKDHLSQLNTRHSSTLVTTLQSSLNSRLGNVVDDPLYICGAILDHRFKVKWSTDVDKHKKVLQEEVSKLAQHSSPESSSEDEPPAPKRSKLFSFMAVPGKVRKKRKRNSEQEVHLYLGDDFSCECPLEFWRLKENDYPCLAALAKKVFSVPATSAPVERVFSETGKILNSLRCRMLPKNLETLIFLKMNADYM